MKAVLVVGKNYEFNNEDFTDSYVVGVDNGALLCYQNGISMDVAIGDFDSINDSDLDLIKKSTKVIKLNPVKDKTDTEEAIELCTDYDKIIILGGISGRRIEHFYANLLLCEKNPNLSIKDDNSYIFTADTSICLDRENYKYISIFSLDNNTNITLKGFKYPLNEYKMDRLDQLGISNEIISNGKIIIHSGRILIILSKDDSL